ncbi:MAG: tRNA preQ1(34) S-adenosylmethionine ribosyltransferase-isomerase QueA [Planctomycetes bacterium]|nr:tRNA preQ1(34) S-adenosylmethionine ribosyltransferase-isomerase QueA [Planctomycetota bacterium]
MLVSDFDFDLPPERIAQVPAEPRDAARLLVFDRSDGSVTDTVFRELPAWLTPRDLLVVNDTRVLPHRLCGVRHSGGRVEALVVSRQGHRCRGWLKPARKLRPGESVALEDGALSLVPVGTRDADGLVDFELRLPDGGVDEAELTAVLDRVGRAPLPPYIARDDDDRMADRQRYQTVFATAPGAVAAPTAGMHFTPELLATVRASGTEVVAVTLHVGPGTFAPVRVDRVEDHRMHAERYVLDAEVAAAVQRTRAAGGRVFAVGTTAARTLESCAAPGRTVQPGTGDTDLFLYPGRPLGVLDALLTNFHLPRSTLLMLVAALTGRDRILELYRGAIERGYRFYSYGDAMLIV